MVVYGVRRLGLPGIEREARVERPVLAHALRVLDAAAQVEIESKVGKRFIILWLQALRPSAGNPGSIWGQPGVNLHRSTVRVVVIVEPPL